MCLGLVVVPRVAVIVKITTRAKKTSTVNGSTRIQRDTSQLVVEIEQRHNAVMGRVYRRNIEGAAEAPAGAVEYLRFCGPWPQA